MVPFELEAGYDGIAILTDPKSGVLVTTVKVYSMMSKKVHIMKYEMVGSVDDDSPQFTTKGFITYY